MIYDQRDTGDENEPLMSELDRAQWFGAIPVKSDGCIRCGTPLDFDGVCPTCEPE